MYFSSSGALWPPCCRFPVTDLCLGALFPALLETGRKPVSPWEAVGRRRGGASGKNPQPLLWVFGVWEASLLLLRLCLRVSETVQSKEQLSESPKGF